MSLRDGWCTPRPITKRLPRVDYDPCSNGRSTVKATRSAILARGENGLLESWEDFTVGVNPPWSDPKPFTVKAWEAKDFWFLVKEDPSTEWWDLLTAFPCFRFSFNYRVGFRPPPGIDESTNEHPTCLVVTPRFRVLIGDAFKGMGRWWASQ